VSTRGLTLDETHEGSKSAYVLTVATHAGPEGPSSGTLTDVLLAPLCRWQSYVSASTQSETQPAAPAPAPAAPVQVALTPAAPTLAPANGPSAGGPQAAQATKLQMN